MNVFEKVNNYFTERRLTKLKRDIEKLCDDDFSFNPYKHKMPLMLTDQASEVQGLIERMVWYSGDGNAIRNFYKDYQPIGMNTINMKESYFWYSAPEKLRHVHSGVPQLISETMGNILFRRPFEINCEVRNEDGTIDEKASEVASETITNICKELHLNELCYKAAVMNSYSGHVDFKFTHDLTLDYKPIIDVYDRRFFSIRKARGITQEHVFTHPYYDKKAKKEYRLDEIYGRDDYGYATIDYHLYELTAGQEKEVPLTTLEETANLEETRLGITGFGAFDIPNLASASLRNNYPYGKSDYEGAIDLFDTLDEDVTQIVAEIRDKRPIREFDERMLEIDSQGNKQILEYVTNYLKAPHDNTENAKGVTTTEFNDETANHILKFQNHLALCCAKVKISPISLGIPGLNAIDASDKSTREKSKVTTETRDAKIQLWKPFLEKLIKKAIEYSKYLTTLPGFNRNDLDAIEWKQMLDSINTDGMKINIIFQDYLSDSLENKIATAVNGLSGGVYSLETAIDEIYGKDWTEVQKKEEINRILYRQGMSSDVKELEELENGTDNNPNEGGNNG